MSKSAQSVFYFGIYLLFTGATFLVAPNMMMGMLGMPPSEEIWSRIVGVLVIFIGVYYAAAGRLGLTPFFQVTVFTRFSLIVFLGGLVAAGLAEPQLLMFGLIDILGAAWTLMALRKEKILASQA